MKGGKRESIDVFRGERKVDTFPMSVVTRGITFRPEGNVSGPLVVTKVETVNLGSGLYQVLPGAAEGNNRRIVIAE